VIAQREVKASPVEVARGRQRRQKAPTRRQVHDASRRLSGSREISSVIDALYERQERLIEQEVTLEVGR
jgi:hypothetical protein